MTSAKLAAGSKFPELTVHSLDGSTVDISKPQSGCDWKMIVVYRGQHCPLCTLYLNALEKFNTRLNAIGIDLAVVSGDSKAQLERHFTELNISYPIYYGLTIEQMQDLGLYISNPRSANETDHPFSEPGLFIINESGDVQIIDISNSPAVRPELETLVSGMEWVRDNDYPIRGTF